MPRKSLNPQNAVVHFSKIAAISVDALIVEDKSILYYLESVKVQARIAHGRVVAGIRICKGECRRHVQRTMVHTPPVATEVVR